MGLKVCIIGAGAAGLAAIRHISASKMTGVIFEATNDIGGIWNYTDRVGTGIHSAAYKGLRTNLPKEIMGFLDYDIVGKTSFLQHEEVLEFLRSYAQEFNLLEHIQFDTRVMSIRPKEPNPSNQSSQWEVTVQRRDKTNEVFIFDAVMICNGHYSKPQLPQLLGIEQFSGEILHSRYYRIPQQFTNNRVVVLGCGPSGIDIALEIALFASKVVISMRNVPYPGKLPSNICQMGVIQNLEGSHVIFETGEKVLCDVLLLCTGYEYEMPFQSSECGLMIEKGKRINHLYRQMINVKNPTMALIGVPFRVCPFMLFDAQVRYFVSYLSGRFKLPSEEEMLLEIADEIEHQKLTGIPFSRSHQLEDLQWDYYKRLGVDGGFAQLFKPYTREIYEQVGLRRRDDPQDYKNDLVYIESGNAVLLRSSRKDS